MATSAKNIPVIPPMRKLNTTPKTNNIGVFSHSLPIHMVPSADRNTIPVGMEISSVMTMNGM